MPIQRQRRTDKRAPREVLSIAAQSPLLKLNLFLFWLIPSIFAVETENTFRCLFQLHRVVKSTDLNCALTAVGRTWADLGVVSVCRVLKGAGSQSVVSA